MDNKFKEKRESKGLTQAELAKRTGVTKWLIQKYDQNTQDINSATFKTLVNLSVVLDCKITDILTDKELIDKCKKIEL